MKVYFNISQHFYLSNVPEAIFYANKSYQISMHLYQLNKDKFWRYVMNPASVLTNLYICDNDKKQAYDIFLTLICVCDPYLLTDFQLRAIVLPLYHDFLRSYPERVIIGDLDKRKALLTS